MPIRKYLLMLCILSLFIRCQEDPGPYEHCNLDIENYDFTYGIDYSSPPKYLEPGEQSYLSPLYASIIHSDLGVVENNITGLLQVSDWINDYFTYEITGGSMIGTPVNYLFETKKLYGCHSAALALTAALRIKGFPAIIVETASIAWAEEKIADDVDYYSGHVMTEVFVEGQWILVDNDGTHVLDYDEINPFISSQNSGHSGEEKGLFVIAKGKDSWDYNVYSEYETHKLMEGFAWETWCFKDWFDSVNYTWEH